MADVMSYGGDGAGDPLQQSPHRLESYCESGISQGINLEKVWQANGKRLLPTAFDNVEHKIQLIENNVKYFMCLVGNQVRFTVPPCYPSWTEVPEEQRTRLHSIIESYFDLQGDRSPNEYRAVYTAIDRLAADRIEITNSRSTKNKANRCKAKYPSVQGLKSFSGTRYDEWDPETHQWPGIVESFWTFYTF
ncbi:Uncharacterized protein Adt_35746 [Abeliophyllum distichum]|uniref:Uncharacterized protein n=1 Tax=Abeliophyllum distichum TaxID=126358 RepID=A0ABD1QFL5_9LAMI